MNAPDAKFTVNPAKNDVAAGHGVVGEVAGVLAGIFAPATQIALWQRPPDASISAWLDELAAHGALGRLARRLHLRPGEAPVLDDLPAHPGRTALAADLALLADLLTELTGADTIALRLEVLDRAMCPRFHVDRVGLRLVCAYRGPGTEWVDDAGVDRRRLGAGAGGLPDESSGLLPPGQRIERAPLQAVAVMKGSLWQDNGMRGLIHRSPTPLPGDGPRLFAALDAGWSD